MKINTKSWHFRLMKFTDVYPQYRYNLCEYIRGFMVALLKVLIGGGFMISLAALVVVCLICGVVGWFVLDFSSKVQPGWFVFFVIGNGAYFTAGILGLWWCWVESRAKRHQLWRKITKQHSCTYYRKEPNVFLQWIKDRHKKICRLIEFV